MSAILAALRAKTLGNWTEVSPGFWELKYVWDDQAYRAEIYRDPSTRVDETQYIWDAEGEGVERTVVLAALAVQRDILVRALMQAGKRPNEVAANHAALDLIFADGQQVKP